MKLALKIIGGVLLAILLLVGLFILSASNKKRKFIKETVAILSTMNSPADIKSISPGYRPEFILMRQFKNGGWAAVRALDEEENDYGFTAALIYTGNGNFWLSDYGFCGYEELEGMSAITADTPEEFVSAASDKFGFYKFAVK